MNFKGLDDWIAIFRGGLQTDSQGRQHDGDELIDQAIRNFDVNYHEPPVCVGHPVDDAPAFAWVEGLKKTGSVLYAKFRDIVPEFAQAVEQGLYRKRSASFYPDGRLRHVAFLGAAPPAVKGLQALSFEGNENSVIIFDFKEENMTEKMKKLLQYFGFDVGKIPAEAMPGSPKTEKKEKKEVGNMKTSGQFSEEELAAVRKEAVEAEREKVKADFAEAAQKAKVAERVGKITGWCERMLKEGKLTPSLMKSGIPEVLAFAARGDETLEFGEEKVELTALDYLQKLFEEHLPKLVNFGEFAGRKVDTGGKTAKQLIETKIVEKMKTNKGMEYGVAFSEIQKEEPALIKMYMEE